MNYDDPFGLSPADGCDPPGSCQSLAVMLGGATGGVLGGVVSVVCAGATAGFCTLAGPELTLGLSGFGASVGLAIGNRLEIRGKKGGKGADRENQHPLKRQSTGKSEYDRHTRRHGQRNPPYNPNKRGDKPNQVLMPRQETEHIDRRQSS